MRMKEDLECYIDGYSTVNIYMNRNFYGGKSRIFHLKDEKERIIPMTIDSHEDFDRYIHYTCTLDEDLDIGQAYTCFDEHCRTAPAQYAHIVKTPQFEEEFALDAKSSRLLGIHYTPKKTRFSVWAPTAAQVSLVLLGKDEAQNETIEMDRHERGVWSTMVPGDLLGRRYVYQIRVNGKIHTACDPYSPFTGLNTEYSVVDDLSLLDLPEKVPTPSMEHQTDAIIYEASIRDMTSQAGIGVSHPRRFTGFTEENETTRQKDTGFTYLKSLGITHVQLMPVLDFGSVDEKYPNIFYNWGYDPVHFRALEGSYASHPEIARNRIEEFSRMVQKLHEAGIKVTLDLVFNHVWSKDTYVLDKLVPDYYFMMDQFGNLSGGSFCGNDVDSRVKMSRQYMLETARYLVEVLDVDGFRFDLMGILDYHLLNDIAEMAKSIKPDFMIYGEGWDMGSFLPSELRASQNNQDKMPLVGQFSDRFREVIRGSNNDLDRPGFSSGNLGAIQDAAQVMCASVLENRFDDPAKAINYVECHDNHTLWDKNRECCKSESSETRESRQTLANAMVLMAQGVPFLHAGQEFGRTKQNLGNSYNRSDSYNRIDYNRRTHHQRIVDATRKLIEIRKSHPSLRLADVASIQENVKTETIADAVLVVRTQAEGDRLICFFNPSDSYYEYHLHEQGKTLFDSGNANHQETERVVIAPISAVIVSLPA